MDYLYMAPFLVFLGFVPSLVWLFYYLKKDCHPEPKSLIARTLFIGILVAPLAIAAELLFTQFFKHFFPGLVIADTVYFFIWAAFIEEYVKYLAVKLTVINNPNFDEPIDAMIYMISAGLGFAAIENILVLFNAYETGMAIAAQTLLMRFAGATLLHAISSALLGYFLGLSWFYARHSKKILVAGLATAALAHLAFNISLLATETASYGIIISSSCLFLLIFLISFLFRKLKKRMAENPPLVIT